MYESRHNDRTFITRICKAVQQEYGLNIYKIVPAKRGVYGETWTLYTDHLKYFVKIDYSPNHQKIFADNLDVISYLKKQGIDYISTVIRNKAGGNYILFYDGVLAVFEYISGELTKIYHKELLFEMLAKIYQITPLDIVIDREDFSIKCANYIIENMQLICLLYTSDDADD